MSFTHFRPEKKLQLTRKRLWPRCRTAPPPAAWTPARPPPRSVRRCVSWQKAHSLCNRFGIFHLALPRMGRDARLHFDEKKWEKKNGLATNRIFSLCQELNSHGQIRNEASFRQQRGRRLVFGTAAAKKKVFNPQVNCRIMRSRWRPQKTFVKKRRHSFAGNLLRCSFRC